MSRRINRVVVENRLATGSCSGLRQFHLFLGKLRAIPLGAQRFDVNAAEQSLGQRTAVTFATGRGAGAVHQVVSFPRGGNGVNCGTAWRNQARRIIADIRAVGTDVQQLHSNDVYTCTASRWLIFQRGRCQQIRKCYSQTVATVHAQHNRPGPFVGAQANVAGGEAFGSINRHNVRLECVDHAMRIHGAETVESNCVIERHHVGLDCAITNGRRRCRRWRWKSSSSPSFLGDYLLDLRLCAECSYEQHKQGNGEQEGKLSPAVVMYVFHLFVLRVGRWN